MFLQRALFLAVACFVIGRSLYAEDRSFDGKNNNLGFPTQGASDEPFVRIVYPSFVRAFEESPDARINTRDISNAFRQTESRPNARGLSDFVWMWGQFLAHDISLTLTSNGSATNGTMSIPITDPNDPLGPNPIPFVRSDFRMISENPERIAPVFPCVADAPCREQINANTSYIDASTVYGSTANRAAALRTDNGAGARLLTSAGNRLPLNTLGLDNENIGLFPDEQLYVAGDRRSNENPLLTSIHSVFMREHNRLVDLIEQQQPQLDAEQTYQLARKIVGAEVQAITYNEFLPTMIGRNAPNVRDYNYDASVIGTATQSFSHAIGRWGHSAVSPTLRMSDPETGEALEPIALRDAFFTPTVVGQNAGRMDQLLKGAAHQVSQEIDVFVVDELREFLFGAPGAGGLDLVALNLQRGRDHGVPTFPFLQLFYRTPFSLDMDTISSDQIVTQALRSLHDDINEIDPWVGAMAQDHLPDSSFGELSTAVLADQFTRLRDGDRLFYSSDAAGLYADGKIRPEIRSLIELDSLKLSDIILANTAISHLQDHIFFARQVTGDFDDNGVLDANDIDMLSTEMRADHYDAQFDLNLDQAVNELDHQTWVREVHATAVPRYFICANRA